MITAKNIETLVATLIFGGVLLVRSQQLFEALPRRLHLFSLFAGASIAYAFIHLIPAAEKARVIFLNGTPDIRHPFEGHGIYVAMMLGFVFFFGFQRLIVSSESETDGVKRLHRRFWMHIGVMGVYVMLIAYLLMHNVENEERSMAFYAATMSLHFLMLGHSLHQLYGALYDQLGRRVLAGCALAGWLVGLAINVSMPVIAVSVAFLIGALIVNTLIMELPSEREGRFLPFLLGAVSYTVILLIAA